MVSWIACEMVSQVNGFRFCCLLVTQSSGFVDCWFNELMV